MLNQGRADSDGFSKYADSGRGAREKNEDHQEWESGTRTKREDRPTIINEPVEEEE